MARTAAVSTKTAPAARKAVAPAAPATRKPASVPATKPAAKTAAKSAKPNLKNVPQCDGYYFSEAIDPEAIVLKTGEKSFFIANFSTFKDDKGEVHNPVMFMKGYGKEDEDGVKRVYLSGRSGTIPQEFFTSEPEVAQEFINRLKDWLESFLPAL
jgi:hypothetical protein